MSGFRTNNTEHKCNCGVKGCKCTNMTKHNWCGACSQGKHTMEGTKDE